MSLIAVSPNNFRKTNIDNSPPSITLEWDELTNATVRNDFFKTNDENIKTPTLNGSNPSHLTAHNREVLGYQLYRHPSSFTPPSEGTLIADTDVLTPSTTSFVDTNVLNGQSFQYVLLAVVRG